MKRTVIVLSALFVLLISQSAAAQQQAQQHGTLTFGAKGTLWDVTENAGDRYYGFDSSVGYHYPISLAKAATLNLGLTLGLNNGFEETLSRSLTSITPDAALKWKGLSVKLSFTRMNFLPDEKKSLYCLSDKAMKLWIKNNYASNDIDDSFGFLYDQISYTFAINKKMSVIPSVESEILFAPEAGFLDLRPGVTFRYGPLMVNGIFSMYFLPEEDTALDTSTYLYIDGGIRYALGNFVKGLAVGFNGTFPVTKDLEGVVLQPRIYYAAAGFNMIASFRIINVDGENPTFSPFLNCSYTVKL